MTIFAEKDSKEKSLAEFVGGFCIRINRKMDLYNDMTRDMAATASV